MSIQNYCRSIVGMSLWAVLLLTACTGQPLLAPSGLNPAPIWLAAVEGPSPIGPRAALTLVATAPTQLEPSPPLVGWPVAGRVSQGFGCSSYYSGRRGPGCPAEAPWFHDGIDIAVPTGTPIRAAITGTVIFAGPDGTGPACGAYRGYGLGVVVEAANEWQTLYAHLVRIDVAKGQVVTPETLIGAVGQTGCVTGPHLHFGLRQADRLVDPALYIKEKN